MAKRLDIESQSNPRRMLEDLMGWVHSGSSSES